MILCQLHPWERMRQFWCRFRAWASGPPRIGRLPFRPRKFDRAELIEKYGFNRHL